MDNTDFEEYLDEQEDIRIHNENEFEKLNSLLDKYSDNDEI